MGTLYSNILELCSMRGIKGGKMCVDLGISKSLMTDLKSGRKKSVNAETAQKIAAYFGVSVGYLLGDEAEKQIERPLAIGEELTDMALIRFPVIGSIAAGFNCCAQEEHTGEYAYFPSSELSASPDEYFVLRIKGSSMYPKLLEGDLVLVRRKTSVDSGKIAVVLYNGEDATVKKVNYVYGQDWLELVPINPEHQAKRIDGIDLEQCRVLGEVVKLQRNL